MKTILFSVFLFFQGISNGFGQAAFFGDSLNITTLADQYNIIAIGEYVHGSDNINTTKFEIAQKIMSAKDSFLVVLEAGMDECVIYNRRQTCVDTIISKFYPIYRDSSFRNFLLELKQTNHPLYGFDCQYFHTEAFLPEFKGSYENFTFSDSIINAAINSPKKGYLANLNKEALSKALLFYGQAIEQLEKMYLSSDALKHQLKAAILNRISVANALRNEDFFWDIRDSLMFECFNNLKNVLGEKKRQYILLGSSAHLSPCEIQLKWGSLKPMGMYFNDFNSYFIHIAGYSGKVANIFGKEVDVDFVKNENFQAIKISHPNGFSISLTSNLDISGYSIPFYNGSFDSGCGDFYINLGAILPSRKIPK